MSDTKTSEPTREEINQALAEFMGVDVSHSWQETPGTPNCKLCGDDYSEVFSETVCPKAIPIYCSDSSARSLLNEVVAKVIEDFSPLRYHRALYTVVPIKDKRASLVERTSELIRATAEQIARSCYLAIKEQKT